MWPIGSVLKKTFFSVPATLRSLQLPYSGLKLKNGRKLNLPLLPLSSLESSCLPLPGYHCYSVGGKTADSSLMLPWGSGWSACCTNRQENRRSMNIARLKQEVVMSESVGIDEVVDGSDSRALLASYSVIASFASSCPIM